MKRRIFVTSIAATLMVANVSFAESQMSGETHHDMEALTLGDLVLHDPFAFATLPNQPVAGGFMRIENMGEDDRLIAAASPIAGEVQIHEMAMEGDVMRMRELPEGLTLPAGEFTVLEPGGYHIMFMQLDGPLVEGENVSVTLTFESAGEITIDMPILSKMDGMPMNH